MFTLNIQHQKGPSGSFLNNRNLNPFIRYQQGYRNHDSPIKAAFRCQVSPRKSLSPYKIHNDSRTNVNRSRSPIISSKQTNSQFSNRKVSPFRNFQQRNNQEDNHYESKNISFTSLIRKNSNNVSEKNMSGKRGLDYSNGNYLQSDRNFREDTNLFRKLADMLESNRSNKSFINSGISQNSVKNRVMPQSCKNQNSSNKKIFIRNVATIESIQSPEQSQFIEQAHYCSQTAGIQTRCYSQYEKLTTQHIPTLKNNGLAFKQRQELISANMLKKPSNDYLRQLQIPTFKKILSNNERNQFLEQDQKGMPIDYHLTNSFGATASLKSQIVGGNRGNHNFVKPFEEISFENQAIKMSRNNFQDNHLLANHDLSFNSFKDRIQQMGKQIPASLHESQDSVFASLHMLMQKVNQKEDYLYVHKQNQSINISITSQSESMELDMEPFLQKRK